MCSIISVFMSVFKKIIPYFISIVVIWSCSQTHPVATEDGLCGALDCSNARLLSPDGSFSIEPLFESSLGGLECKIPDTVADELKISGPYLYKFKISSSAGGGGEGESSTSGRVLPNVKVNIFTVGGVFSDIGDHNPFADNPEEYNGIATPVTEWCSDDCGILSVEVFLKCPPEGVEAKGNLNISSATTAYTLEITAKNEKEEEEEE